MYQKTVDYQRARTLILKRLKRDKSFHEQGLLEKMGEAFDDFDLEFPPGSPDLMIAWSFWDAWIEERNQGFPNNYEGIAKDSWPHLAAQIIERLEKNEKISDAVILKHFDFSEKPNWFKEMSQNILSIFRSPRLKKEEKDPR